MSRPYAAFDIDGTLIRWQLYHALADNLAKHRLLDEVDYQAVKAARMTWKERAGENSFDDYEKTLVRVVNRAISNISVAQLKLACEEVMSEYRDQVYTFSRDLINELKAKKYLLFAISGSQQEVVEMLAQYYGFDDWAGTIYETRNGQYTGKSLPLRSNRKQEVLEQLIKKHAAIQEGSLAVGDSESDIPMLSAVEKPIAFNPNKALFEHACKHNWSIVLERKNVVYKLEPSNGSYILAPTD